MKNKTITIYELLSLVKDEKQPKKVFFNNRSYFFGEVDEDYIDEDEDYLFMNLFQAFPTNNVLNKTVEIIEDNDKLEKIKWNEKESRAGILRTDQEIEVLAKRTETLKKKIAELVDHINKIEEKLDER